jgi:curved DNA-binding protein
VAKRDYYQILGVTKSATADDIKTSYRRLARQYHPDINKEPTAQARFTEVQEAYDVLSDEARRKMYDVYGHDAPSTDAPSGRASGRAAQTWSGSSGGVKINLEDLGSVFDTFFGDSGAPFGSGASQRGGKSSSKARGRASPWDEPAEELHHDLHVDFLSAARGTTERVRMMIDETPRTIEVAIPKGIADGTKLRVRGQTGEPDLILNVRVNPHALFRRGGARAEGESSESKLDLYLDLPLTIAEATLGATVTVPTIEGQVEMAVPPGSPSGTKLRLRGRGIDDGKGTPGDLYVVVKIVPPALESLSPDERDILRKMTLAQGSPRTALGWKP